MLLIVRFLIRVYQWTISPVLSSLGGAATGCRFQPTCSHYFLEAVETHGFFRGSWLGLRRLGRCQPWGGEGFDPVPASETFNPPVRQSDGLVPRRVGRIRPSANVQRPTSDVELEITEHRSVSNLAACE